MITCENVLTYGSASVSSLRNAIHSIESKKQQVPPLHFKLFSFKVSKRHPTALVIPSRVRPCSTPTQRLLRIASEAAHSPSTRYGHRSPEKPLLPTTPSGRELQAPQAAPKSPGAWKENCTTYSMTHCPKGAPGGHEAQSRHVVHIRTGSMVVNHSPHITEAEIVNRGNPSSPAIATSECTTTTQSPLSANTCHATRHHSAAA